jgi:hypothetical protein
MFKEISDPMYLIFYFLTNRQRFLREVEKVVSSVRLALCILILLSTNPTIRLVRFRENNVSGGP